MSKKETKKDLRKTTTARFRIGFSMWLFYYCGEGQRRLGSLRINMHKIPMLKFIFRNIYLICSYE